MDILFDDIGSYPLPKGVTREWVEDAFMKRDRDGRLFSIIQSAMRQKLEAGLDVANYPQFQDMNQMFLRIINDPAFCEEPLLVREDKAKIVELEAIEPLAREYVEKHGRRLRVRVCITGPVELYLKQFGGSAFSDVLNNLARSIDRFIRNSIKNEGSLEVSTISIDEPSLGINPQIMFKDEDIIEALSVASSSASAYQRDTEIHLHSPLHYKLICEVSSINIIGVESAANPSYLELIDKKDIEESDSSLRVGVSRTDIHALVAELNEKYGTNVWREPGKLNDIITSMETPKTIAGRLENAYRIFGDLVRYAGPDCGLGSWPSQEIAYGLLKNTGDGIKEFLKSSRVTV